MPIDELNVEEYNYELNEEEFYERLTYVVYVKKIGSDISGDNVYHIYLSEHPDDVFAEGWGEVPACNVRREFMDISDEHYQNILELRTPLVLDLAQDCCCFSMQDARDRIVALAYENLDNAEEYPEPRIIIQFGEETEVVEEMFAKRDIALKYIE